MSIANLPRIQDQSAGRSGFRSCGSVSGDQTASATECFAPSSLSERVAFMSPPLPNPTPLFMAFARYDATSRAFELSSDTYLLSSMNCSSPFDASKLMTRTGQCACSRRASTGLSWFCMWHTCVGGFAPVYVSEEIEGNRFTIAGGREGLKVSWQVTGIRKDSWAEANRIPTEVDKAPEDRGSFLHPEAHGLPAERGIYHQRDLRELKDSAHNTRRRDLGSTKTTPLINQTR